MIYVTFQLNFESFKMSNVLSIFSLIYITRLPLLYLLIFAPSKQSISWQISLKVWIKISRLYQQMHLRWQWNFDGWPTKKTKETKPGVLICIGMCNHLEKENISAYKKRTILLHNLGMSSFQVQEWSSRLEGLSPLKYFENYLCIKNLKYFTIIIL